MPLQGRMLPKTWSVQPVFLGLLPGAVMTFIFSMRERHQHAVWRRCDFRRVAKEPPVAMLPDPADLRRFIMFGCPSTDPQ